MPALFGLWNSIQQCLLPHIEENIGSLTEKGAECIGGGSTAIEARGKPIAKPKTRPGRRGCWVQKAP